MGKRSTYISGAVIFLAIILIMTNPAEQEYLEYDEKQIGDPLPADVEIERMNFFFFSIYTPIVHHEAGISHLGIFSHFYQISDGQFDDVWWLEFLEFFK